MKKDAYYFPHFSNARNDSKILKLRRVLGIEGYAIYFMLLEVLRDQTDFRLPLSAVEDLEFEFRVSKEKISTVIHSYDLFEVVDGQFFSPKLIFFLQPYLEKTVRARQAAQIRWTNANADANAYTNADANAMQRKESKGEESKVKEKKERKVLVVPTEAEFLDYCKSIEGLNYQPLEYSLKSKYEQWVEAGWKDGNGKAIGNWKTKIKNTIPFLKPIFGMSQKPKMSLEEIEAQIQKADEEYQKQKFGI